MPGESGLRVVFGMVAGMGLAQMSDRWLRSLWALMIAVLAVALPSRAEAATCSMWQSGPNTFSSHSAHSATSCGGQRWHGNYYVAFAKGWTANNPASACQNSHTVGLAACIPGTTTCVQGNGSFFGSSSWGQVQSDSGYFVIASAYKWQTLSCERHSAI